jgi:hypothetical protein
LNSFTVTVNAPQPTVSSVSPTSATLNQSATFTVNGSNLRSGMGFWIADCAGVTDLGGNSTQWRWSCTPGSSAGAKQGSVKDAPGGNVLQSFGVTVADSVPYASTTSTTDGGGTWGSILNMSASISGTTANFTITKQSGTFKSSGTLYLRTGSSNGTNLASAYINAGFSGMTLGTNLSGSGFPKTYYGYYSTTSGNAYVGPITIYWSGH